MQLTEGVAIFPAGPFQMIGNLESGYVIGLTDDGAAICHRMNSEDVSEDEIASVDENLLAHLKAGGFIAGIEAANSPKTGKAAYLHVSPRCNLNCTGCYSKRPDDPSSDLSLESITLAIDRLAEGGVNRLIISGGEPFLRKDLPEIIQHAKLAAKITHVDILTNGTLINPETLNKLANYTDRICVSFDGPSAEAKAFIRNEQRFDQLVKAIQMIKDADIPAHIIATIHAKNANDIPAYKQLAANLGATVSFSLLSAPDTSPEVADVIPDDVALANLAKVLFGASMLSTDPNGGPLSTALSVCALCGAGNKNVSVAADGRIYPCHMLHYDEVCMGSILDSTLEDACSLNPFDGFTVDDIPECSDCNIRYLCGGGCRARAFYATGDPMKRDPYCALMKEHYSILFDALSNMNQAKEVK